MAYSICTRVTRLQLSYSYKLSNYFFNLQKRRSGRNTNKRKKYLDDLDLNLSDEEKHEGEHEEDGPVVKPVSVYSDIGMLNKEIIF